MYLIQSIRFGWHLNSIPVSARSCIQLSAEEVQDTRTSWQCRRLAKILAPPSEKKDLVVSDLEPSENVAVHKLICQVAACMETSCRCRNSGFGKFKQCNYRWSRLYLTTDLILNGLSGIFSFGKQLTHFHFRYQQRQNNIDRKQGVLFLAMWNVL